MSIFNVGTDLGGHRIPLFRVKLLHYWRKKPRRGSKLKNSEYFLKFNYHGHVLRP